MRWTAGIGALLSVSVFGGKLSSLVRRRLAWPWLVQGC
jgi:hypothetical protein